MVTAMVCCIMVIFALVGLIAVSWMNSVRLAASGADLVALGAAQAQAEGEQACQQADKTAADNGLTVEECHLETGYGDFIVDVKVSRAISPHLPSGPERVYGRARAGIVSDLADEEED